jgi:hypothetical protein
VDDEEAFLKSAQRFPEKVNEKGTGLKFAQDCQKNRMKRDILGNNPTRTSGSTKSSKPFKAPLFRRFRDR